MKTIDRGLADKITEILASYGLSYLDEDGNPAQIEQYQLHRTAYRFLTEEPDGVKLEKKRKKLFKEWLEWSLGSSICRIHLKDKQKFLAKCEKTMIELKEFPETLTPYFRFRFSAQGEIRWDLFRLHTVHRILNGKEDQFGAYLLEIQNRMTKERKLKLMFAADRKKVLKEELFEITRDISHKLGKTKATRNLKKELRTLFDEILEDLIQTNKKQQRSI